MVRFLNTAIPCSALWHSAVIFNILLLLCSLCLVFSSILVLFGLWKDKRHLLLPWTFFMLTDIFIEFFHLVYLVKIKRIIFAPFVGVMLTIDCFIFCLNVYCLLCVISQYKQFKTDRLNLDGLSCITPNDNGVQQNNNRKSNQEFQLAVSPYPYQHTNFSVIPEELQSN